MHYFHSRSYLIDPLSLPLLLWSPSYNDESIIYFSLYLLFIIGQVACQYIDKLLSAKSLSNLLFLVKLEHIRNYREVCCFRNNIRYERYKLHWVRYDTDICGKLTYEYHFFIWFYWLNLYLILTPLTIVRYQEINI